LIFVSLWVWALIMGFFPTLVLLSWFRPLKFNMKRNINQVCNLICDSGIYPKYCSTYSFWIWCRHVTRVADQKEDELEALYERRNRKATTNKPKEEDGLQVDRVDALPIKTLDGELQYRTGSHLSPFLSYYAAVYCLCNVIVKYLFFVVV